LLSVYLDNSPIRNSRNRAHFAARTRRNFLLKRVARAEPERINAREWIILLYSPVFILVTWFLAVLLAIYNRNASPTGLKARRALLLHYMVTFNTGQRRMSLPAQQLLKLPYGPQHAEDS